MAPPNRNDPVGAVTLGDATMHAGELTLPKPPNCLNNLVLGRALAYQRAAQLMPRAVHPAQLRLLPVSVPRCL